MQFVYTAGKYCEYRGRVFFDGKPTDITDKATETLLLLNKDFRKVEDEKPRTERIQEAKAGREETKEIVGIITMKNKGGRPRKVH